MCAVSTASLGSSWPMPPKLAGSTYKRDDQKRKACGKKGNGVHAYGCANVGVKMCECVSGCVGVRDMWVWVVWMVWAGGTRW